jgi:hypothetical protein
VLPFRYLQCFAWPAVYRRVYDLRQTFASETHLYFQCRAWCFPVCFLIHLYVCRHSLIQSRLRWLGSLACTCKLAEGVVSGNSQRNSSIFLTATPTPLMAESLRHVLLFTHDEIQIPLGHARLVEYCLLIVPSGPHRLTVGFEGPPPSKVRQGSKPS